MANSKTTFLFEVKIHSDSFPNFDTFTAIQIFILYLEIEIDGEEGGKRIMKGRDKRWGNRKITKKMVVMSNIGEQ